MGLAQGQALGLAQGQALALAQGQVWGLAQGQALGLVLFCYLFLFKEAQIRLGRPHI